MIEEKAIQKKIKGIPFDQFLLHERKKIVDTLRTFWKGQVKEVTRERVIQSIMTGQISPELLNETFINLNGRTLAVNSKIKDFLENSLMPAIASAIGFAGSGTDRINGMMDSINEAVGSNLFFSVATADITDYITKHGANLVVQISDSQRKAIQNVLTSSVKSGWTQGETISMMESTINLTSRESMAVINAYNKAFASELKRFQGEGFRDAISRARANALAIAKKKERFLLNTRARRIVETELKRAQQKANNEAHFQAITAGKIKNVRKLWVSGNTRDNWDSTLLFDGRTAGIEESFDILYGTPAPSTAITFDFPTEINEKCDVVYIVEAA